MQGKVKPYTLSCSSVLLERVDEDLIDQIRDKSGFKLTRSKLIQALLEIALEKKDKMEFSGIYDKASLKKALKS